jgi:hypothetical protein
MSAGELYQQVAAAFLADPTIEASLLADFSGTIEKRFGVAMPKPGKLVRIPSGLRLTYDGKDYDLGDPRTAAKGELNDAELELVSAGDAEADCRKAGWDKPFG